MLSGRIVLRLITGLVLLVAGHAQADLGCPGSEFPSADLRTCYACDAGYRHDVLQAVDSPRVCFKDTAREERTAIFVADTGNLFKACQGGTFANLGETRCHRCETGFQHDLTKRTHQRGVCFRPPERLYAVARPRGAFPADPGRVAQSVAGALDSAGRGVAQAAGQVVAKIAPDGAASGSPASPSPQGGLQFPAERGNDVMPAPQEVEVRPLRDGGRCLTLFGSAMVQLRACDGGFKQAFLFDRDSPTSDSGRFRFAPENKCLAMEGSDFEDGRTIILRNCEQGDPYFMTWRVDFQAGLIRPAGRADMCIHWRIYDTASGWIPQNVQWGGNNHLYLHPCAAGDEMQRRWMLRVGDIVPFANRHEEGYDSYYTAPPPRTGQDYSF